MPDLGLSAQQLANARKVIAEGRRRGASPAELDVALMVALAESELLNQANSNIPESLAIPHEKVGSDHASVGVFQQQVGIWGRAPELMDVTKSAALFFDALAKVKVSAAAPWVSAQAVQKSAFPDGSNYRKHYATAQEIRKALTGANGTGTTGPGLDVSTDDRVNNGETPWISAAVIIANNLRDPEFWKRAGLFAGGAVLVLIALWMLLNETGVIAGATRLGTKIATKGML
jgi:hypothetical protein